MFAFSFMENIDAATADLILDEIQNELRPTRFKNGNWVADYKRLRIVAVKTKEY
jgi:hypothetical protein